MNANSGTSKANALPASAHKPLGPRDYLGLALFASSFAFEAIAGDVYSLSNVFVASLNLKNIHVDAQKTAWRQAKNDQKHTEEFITTGLWSLSRHPKYVPASTSWPHPNSKAAAFTATWAKLAFSLVSGSWSVRSISFPGKAAPMVTNPSQSTSALTAPAFPVGTVVLAAASPVFTYFLLTKVNASR